MEFPLIIIKYSLIFQNLCLNFKISGGGVIESLEKTVSNWVNLEIKCVSIKNVSIGLKGGEANAKWDNVSKSAIFFWQASRTN